MNWITKLKIWMAVMVSSLFCGSLEAADLLVPSQYPDIRSAYQAATTNDRILVANGVYSGWQNTLILDNKVVQVAGAGDQVFFNMGGSFQFITTAPTNTQGIYLVNIQVINGPAANPTIELNNGRLGAYDCTFDNHPNTVIKSVANGVGLTKCRFTANTGNYVVDCDLSGISYQHSIVYLGQCHFESNLGAAVRMINGRLTVEGSEFFNNDIGIVSNQSAYLRVNDSRFYVNRIAISGTQIDRFTLEGSMLSWNGRAVGAVQTRRADLLSSVFVQNGFNQSNPIVSLDMSAVSGQVMARMDHCTVADNTSLQNVIISGNGVATTVVTNNIIHNPQLANGSEILVHNPAATTHTNNLVRGGGFGTAVVNAAPEFTQFDFMGLDYSLKSTSPARDVGIMSFVTQDFCNSPWSQDGMPDLGAVEYCRHINAIKVLGTNELMFHGQSGDMVGLAVGGPLNWYHTPGVTPTMTPLGLFYLDPTNYFFFGGIGTINSNGVFSVSLAAATTARLRLWGQALIGPELSKNAQYLYLK